VHAFLALVARGRARRFESVLQFVEDHIAATGEQRPGWHLTSLARRLTSSSILRLDRAFRAEAFLRLARANSRLDNVDEAARLGRQAANEFQKIRPRRGKRFDASLRTLGFVNADIGREFRRLGLMVPAYEKFKLALDLLGCVEAAPGQEAIEREARQVVSAILTHSKAQLASDPDLSAALPLIEILSFDLLNPEDKVEVLRVLTEALTANQAAVFPTGDPLHDGRGLDSNAWRLLSEAGALFARGNFLPSMMDAHASFIYALQERDAHCAAVALGHCGNCCLALGRPSDSLVYLSAAEVFAKTLSSTAAVKAQILGAQGNAYRVLGWGQESEQKLSEAAQKAVNNHDMSTAARATMDLARALLAKDDFAGAEAKLESVRGMLRTTPALGATRDCVGQLRMTECLVELSRFFLDKRDSCSRRAEDWQLLACRVRAYVGSQSPFWWPLLDRIDGARGQPQRIVGRYLKRATDLSVGSLDQPSHIAASFHYGLYVEYVEKAPRRAAKLFEKAAGALDDVRQRVVELGYRRSIAGHSAAIYDHLVACAARAGDIDQAFRASDLARARALFELVQAGPEQLGRSSVHRPVGATAGETLEEILLHSRIGRVFATAPALDVETVRARLAQRECLLQFHVLPEETFIFAITGGAAEPRLFRTDCGETRLKSMLRECGWDARLADLESPAESNIDDHKWHRIIKGFDAALNDLLDALTAELIGRARDVNHGTRLEDFLATGRGGGFSNVVLVPHRDLWTVPLHCLRLRGTCIADHQDASGRVISVTYAHSSAILAQCRARRRKRSQRLMVVVHPDFEDAVQAFRDRTDVSIRRHADPSVLLSELNAGADAPSGAALDVHFATHAVFAPENPITSELVLGNGESLSLAEILENLRTDAVETVFLAACSSGRVEREASADYFGLATGFLKGGARNVIGTFWPIGVAFGASLEEAYYRHWPQKPPASALAQAIHEVRQDRTVSTWEWASFYCMGAGDS
jgi:tetratricopeptide (TPR) repeat protein